VCVYAHKEKGLHRNQIFKRIFKIPGFFFCVIFCLPVIEETWTNSTASDWMGFSFLGMKGIHIRILINKIISQLQVLWLTQENRNYCSILFFSFVVILTILGFELWPCVCCTGAPLLDSHLWPETILNILLRGDFFIHMFYFIVFTV
jgi:hypothetical protein